MPASTAPERLAEHAADPSGTAGITAKYPPGTAGTAADGTPGGRDGVDPAEAPEEEASPGLLTKAAGAAISAAQLTTSAAASVLGVAVQAIGGSTADETDADRASSPGLGPDAPPTPEQPGLQESPAVKAQPGQQQPGLLRSVTQAVGGATVSAAGAVRQAAAGASEQREAEEAEGGAGLATKVKSSTLSTAAAVADAVAPADEPLEGGAAVGAGAGSEGTVQSSEHPQARRMLFPRPPLPSLDASASGEEERSVSAAGPPPAATGHGYFPGGQEGARGSAPVTVQRSQPAIPSTEVPAEGPVSSGLGSSSGATSGIRQSKQMQEEDWVSELVEELWPHIRASIEDQCWQMLPDILNASKPTWIHGLELKKCCLGSKEPDISNISVFRDDNPTMEDVFLEFDVDWRSRQDVELEIQTLPQNWNVSILPSFVEKPLVDLLTFSVGVEEAALKGRVRITMRPLLDRLPVVGALHICLIEQPSFDFDLTLGNSSSVPLEPSIKAWLKQTMRDSVFQSYISPEHYFYQLDPSAKDEEKPVGVLLVKVEEAVKVPKMDVFSNSEPFVELYVRASQRRQTTIKPPTKHPRWGESFELPVHVAEHQELVMVLYDYDWASANDEIGRAILPLKDLPRGQEQDVWLDVESEGDKEWEDSKHEMHKRQRIAGAAAKPFTRQKTKACQLHVKVKFLEFSQAEQGLVLQGMRKGMRQALASPQAQGLNPHLRSLLLSGTLTAKVERADGLKLHSLFSRPSVKFVIKCGDQERESASVKASRRGAVEFDQGVDIHLGEKHTESQQEQVLVELLEEGMLRSGVRARLAIPLHDIVHKRCLHQSFNLDGSGGDDGGGKGGRRGARAVVHLEFKPYF